MVALELAEELRGRQWQVHFCANEVQGELREFLLRTGAIIEDDLDAIDLCEFDIVFSQHHLLPLLFLTRLEAETPPTRWPFLVFSHLSPYDPAEVPGPFIERQFADIILANSAETAATIADYGAPFDQAQIFANPAPWQYSRVASEPAEHLKTLLVVSNHENSELSKALRMISQQGVQITHIGRNHKPQRVTPAMIEHHDAVLTIGKTVQYALRSRRPVFNFDRFAGPGWLNTDNFDAAAWYNFSGRDMPRTPNADMLAREIIDGYGDARRFALGIDASRLRAFCLEERITDIEQIATKTRGHTDWHAEKISLLFEPATQAMIRHEARLVKMYQKEFLRRRALEILDVKIQRVMKYIRPVRSVFKK